MTDPNTLDKQIDRWWDNFNVGKLPSRCKQDLLALFTEHSKEVDRLARLNESELYLAIAESNQNIQPNWVAKITFKNRIAQLKGNKGDKDE